MCGPRSGTLVASLAPDMVMALVNGCIEASLKCCVSISVARLDQGDHERRRQTKVMREAILYVLRFFVSLACFGVQGSLPCFLVRYLDLMRHVGVVKDKQERKPAEMLVKSGSLSPTGHHDRPSKQEALS